ncbi:hypothetical protein PMSD_25895 [Paenibacillus macquariensis subsp. defensor]|nr:hypothetical protein PMSD_25895 [Paenibacillus macquariensis subsp. defensor]
MIIGAFVGVGQLKLLKRDLNIRNRRLAVETSLQYLNIYATEIIPEYEKFMAEFKNEVPEPFNAIDLYDGNFNLSPNDLPKELLAETIIKKRLGLLGVLNRYEFFSTGILNKLTDEDLVFVPTGPDFCETIRREYVLISLMRNVGVPYKNTIELYHKWQDRLDVEIFELQKKEADAKIREKGDRYKSSPPIGF